MLSTLVIVALQHSRRVFWFSFGHWLSTPWFFSRSRTRLVFSFFFTQKTFFFFLWTVIRDIFFSCSWPGVFCFFLVPWILVDIWLVNIYKVFGTEWPTMVDMSKPNQTKKLLAFNTKEFGINSPTRVDLSLNKKPNQLVWSWYLWLATLICQTYL